MGVFTQHARWGKIGGRFKRGRPSAGAAAPALAPLGASIEFIWDGTGSDGAAAALRNAPIQTMFYLKGRAVQSCGWMQAKSGSTLASIAGRKQAYLRQKCNIVIDGSLVHNDNHLATDPDLTPTSMNLLKAQIDELIAANPFTTAGGVCYHIGILGSMPSGLSGETNPSSFNPGISIRQRCWDIEQAYILAKGDPRIFWMDPSSINPATMMNDSGNVHPGIPAGDHIGFNIIGPALDSRIVAGTAEQVIEMHRLGTFPNLGATQLFPEPLFGGTTGTKNGTTPPTGNVALNNRFTSNLVGTNIACTKDASSGIWEDQLAVFDAVVNSAENNTVQDRVSTFPMTGAVKGDYALAAVRIVIDDGAGGPPKDLWSFLFSLGTYGSTGALSTISAALVSAQPRVIDTVIYSAPLPIFGTSPFNTGLALSFRWNAASLNGNRIRYSRPSVRLMTKSDHQAEYIGGDTIGTANYVMNLGGVISASTFGTATITVGRWTPEKRTIVGARIYRNGGLGGQDCDQNIGLGTLMATIAGPALTTYVTGAGDGMVQNDVLVVEIDQIASVGVQRTRRANVGITVGA